MNEIVLHGVIHGNTIELQSSAGLGHCVRRPVYSSDCDASAA